MTCDRLQISLGVAVAWQVWFYIMPYSRGCRFLHYLPRDSVMALSSVVNSNEGQEAPEWSCDDIQRP